jgi:tyrosine-protein phosphatase SIW14
MANRWQIVLGLTAVGLVVAAPLLYATHRNWHLRNFRVVEEGVLYRSGQLSPEAFDRVLTEKGIKTVVTLRTSRVAGRLPPDTWEQSVCAAHGARHVRIVPRLWSPDEKGEIPADQAVQAFLDVMSDKSNYPVLVHCFAGIHRTGTMCAIFRMEHHHWPADRAIAEMRQCGFDAHDMEEYIEGYIRGYRPGWKKD